MSIQKRKQIILVTSASLLLLAGLIVGYIGYKNNEAAKNKMKLEIYSKLVPIDGWGTIKNSIKYPEVFYRSGIDGDVYVMVVVDSSGVTRSVRVEPEYPFADTIKSSLQGIKWYPSRRKGKKIIDSIDLSIHFSSRIPLERIFVIDSP
jgi:hypothetical protein